MTFLRFPLLVWAFKDVLRHPVSAVVTILSLLLLVALTTSVVWALHGVSALGEDAISRAPSLIVQMENKSPIENWQNDASARLTSIPGITQITKSLDQLSPFDQFLLGLDNPTSGTIGVSVFHELEALALAPIIERTLPWPVRITVVRENRQVVLNRFSKRSGIYTLFLIPACLGLALLMTGTIRERLAVKKETGLLKLMGWTTSDVSVFYTWRAVVLGVPGILLGLGLSLYWGWFDKLDWALTVIVGVPYEGISIPLSTEGLVIGIGVLLGTIIVPWWSAAVLPALVRSATDPVELIREG